MRHRRLRTCRCIAHRLRARGHPPGAAEPARKLATAVARSARERLCPAAPSTIVMQHVLQLQSTQTAVSRDAAPGGAEPPRRSARSSLAVGVSACAPPASPSAAAASASSFGGIASSSCGRSASNLKMDAYSHARVWHSSSALVVWRPSSALHGKVEGISVTCSVRRAVGVLGCPPPSALAHHTTSSALGGVCSCMAAWHKPACNTTAKLRAWYPVQGCGRSTTLATPATTLVVAVHNNQYRSCFRAPQQRQPPQLRCSGQHKAPQLVLEQPNSPTTLSTTVVQRSHGTHLSRVVWLGSRVVSFMAAVRTYSRTCAPNGYTDAC